MLPSSPLVREDRFPVRTASTRCASPPAGKPAHIPARALSRRGRRARGYARCRPRDKWFRRWRSAPLVARRGEFVQKRPGTCNLRAQCVHPGRKPRIGGVDQNRFAVRKCIDQPHDAVVRAIAPSMPGMNHGKALARRRHRAPGSIEHDRPMRLRCRAPVERSRRQAAPRPRSGSPPAMHATPSRCCRPRTPVGLQPRSCRLAPAYHGPPLAMPGRPKSAVPSLPIPGSAHRSSACTSGRTASSASVAATARSSLDQGEPGIA